MFVYSLANLKMWLALYVSVFPALNKGKRTLKVLQGRIRFVRPSARPLLYALTAVKAGAGFLPSFLPSFLRPTHLYYSPPFASTP